jgi:acetolactate synthase I/II/III large subunit
MTVGELVTARRHGVSFITIVLTDNDLALIRIKQEKRDYPVYGTAVRSGGSLSRGNDVLVFRSRLCAMARSCASRW